MSKVHFSNTLAVPQVSFNYTPILKWIKNVALFVLAPFIGLAYLLLFPFVGFGILAHVLYKNYAPARFVMNVIATPFITLAFVLFGPVLAVGMAAYFGAKALIQNPFDK